MAGRGRQATLPAWMTGERPVRCIVCALARDGGVCARSVHSQQQRLRFCNCADNLVLTIYSTSCSGRRGGRCSCAGSGKGPGSTGGARGSGSGTCGAQGARVGAPSTHRQPHTFRDEASPRRTGLSRQPAAAGPPPALPAADATAAPAAAPRRKGGGQGAPGDAAGLDDSWRWRCRRAGAWIVISSCYCCNDCGGTSRRGSGGAGCW
jgi:hypothetical protein